MTAQSEGRQSGARIRGELLRLAPTILVRTVLVVLAAEFFAHVVLRRLVPSAGGWGSLLDTFLLLLLMAAPLYWFVFRPLARLASQAAALTAEPEFRALLEAAPDGMVVIDRKGRMALVNLQAEEMFGYNRAELLGQPVEVLVPERLRGAHVEHLSKYFSMPGIRPMGAGLNLVGCRKDGSEFPVDISLSPLETEDGILVTSIIRDITERKRAEEVLKESEERFRSVAESALEAIILADGQGNIVSWNRGAQTMFGYAEEEVLGLPLTHFMPERYRGAHQKGIERMKATREVRLVGKSIDLHGLRKDGTEFPLELSLASWRSSKGVFFSAIVRDTTKRKQAEDALRQNAERFRQLLESLPVAIRVVQDGMVVFCNSADAALHGFEGTEEIIGVDAFLYFEEEDAQRLWEHAGRRAAGDPTVPNRYEAHVKRADGRVVPVEIVSTRILHAGRPASLTVLLDLSERKRLQLYESILPVCCVCGKVRDDSKAKQGKAAWRSLEAFVTDYSDTSLSHTFCPICYQEYRRQQGLPPEAA